MRYKISRPIQAVTAALFLALAGGALATRPVEGRQDNAASTPGARWMAEAIKEDNCLACHQKHDGEIMQLYAGSLHAAERIGCYRCHGGDPFAAAKEQAHAGRFVGRPNAEEIMRMCASCHRQQFAVFREGRHYPERKGVTRLDCSSCHGAHMTGSAERVFSMRAWCAGCHGLEYLPELPHEFQEMLKLSDELTARSHGAPADFRERRKAFSRRLAEIVHATDLDGGRQKAAELLQLGEEIKK